MTLFLPCTYHDSNEVQQEHPKNTLLTNNRQIKTFKNWIGCIPVYTVQLLLQYPFAPPNHTKQKKAGFSVFKNERTKL